MRGYRVHLTLTSDCEGEYEWELEARVAPGSPGRLYGPPEDCYPPEPPEVEDFEARCPAMGLSTDDMALFAFFWRDGADEDDVYEAVIEAYEEDYRWCE